MVTERVEATGDDMIVVVTSTTPSIQSRPRLKFDSMSGGNMGTSLDIFRKVGLFEENPVMATAEDAEFAYREVPILFLMRHPCAVLTSRMELGWATDRDIEPFLSQPDLVTDHLALYMDLIRNAATPEEKHAMIWSVSNLVPLKQFHPNEIRIVYYETLCTQPEMELPAIFASIGQRYEALKNDTFSRASQTTRASSAVVNGTDKI